MKYINILFALLLSGIFTQLKAQNTTMYYLANVPQTYQLNPATQPGCNFFIGGQSATTLLNTAISPSDFFWYDNEMDSVVNPFTSRASLTEFLDKFDDTEQIRMEQKINFLSFGFRANSMYFCFDATFNTSNRISYPKSMVEFMLLGNTDGAPYNFSNMNFESLNYMEFALNISRNFGDILTIGVRPKLLYGLATMSTQENDITLQTSTEQWQINTHSITRMAVTGLPLPVNEDGAIDFSEVPDVVDSVINDAPSVSEIISTFNKNRGVGIDIGVHFRPLELFEFSASLVDLGYINWRDKPQSMVLDGSFRFTGIDINIPDSLDRFEPVIDSLLDNLSLTNTGDPFKTRLNPKLYLGGRIFLTPKIDVGLISKTEFYPEKTNQDFILLADFRLLKGFALSTSYSMLGKGHSSIGLGWSVKVGPFSSFFMSEYNPFRYDRITENGENKNIELNAGDFNLGIPLIIPVDVYGFSIRMGASLTIGCNKVKKLKKDKPMFNSTEWNY